MSRSVVLIPTYNEVDNLPLVLERVFGTGDFNVIVIDDASPDGTGELAESLKSEYDGRLSVIHRKGKDGLGRAYLDGYRQALRAGYDYIFQMDADLSHDPASLLSLRKALRHAHVAIGSRYVEGGGSAGWSERRRLLSSFGSLYSRTILGVPVYDITGGFKGFRRQALAALDLKRISARGYGFQIEVTNQLYKAGFRVTEVPIVFGERATGTSKMSLSIIGEAFVLPWRLRLSEAQRLSLATLIEDALRSLRSLFPTNGAEERRNSP
jgi:dolichol-phosphate mannosyltransferase